MTDLKSKPMTAKKLTAWNRTKNSHSNCADIFLNVMKVTASFEHIGLCHFGVVPKNTLEAVKWAMS